MTEQHIDPELRRLEEIQLLEEKGVEPYPYSFDKTHNALEILAKFKDEKPDEFSDIKVAGRIMSFRRMGKATFCHILDITAKIQVYLKKR